MRDVIKFGKTVSFENLNPHNFHLKNDYINNILFVALSLIPLLEARGIAVEVEQCFISAKYMEATPELSKLRYADKYTKGLGISLRIKDYDHFAMISDMPTIVSMIKSNVHCFLIKNAQLVQFFFEMNDESKVIEVIGEEERRIA